MREHHRNEAREASRPSATRILPSEKRITCTGHERENDRERKRPEANHSSSARRVCFFLFSSKPQPAANACRPAWRTDVCLSACLSDCVTYMQRHESLVIEYNRCAVYRFDSVRAKKGWDVKEGSSPVYVAELELASALRAAIVARFVNARHIVRVVLLLEATI